MLTRRTIVFAAFKAVPNLTKFQAVLLFNEFEVFRCCS